MLLENTQLELMNEAYDSFEHKKMDKETLLEWFKAEDAGFGYGVEDINEAHLDVATKMAQLQEKYINETNFSANVASFTPKLQPLLRRIIPKFIGFDIASVQPVQTPTSEIFMVKAQYAGTTASVADKDTSVILEASTAITVAKGDTITSASGAQGTVVYTEPDFKKMVVNVTSGTFLAGEEFDNGASFSNDGDKGVILGTYSNEAAFKRILPGYSGPYSTADGEVLGSEINQMRVTIVKQGITVKSRKLKAEITLELIKDMSAQHGASASKEIMFFLETEIVNDMNQEIIEKYKEIAVNETNFAIATTNDTQGRWAKEMYSGLYDRILKDKINISNRNRRGPANILIATAGVIAALMSLEKFTDIKSSSVKAAGNHSMNYVGTLLDGTKVFQDWFSTSEYYMPIYLGKSTFDSGVIYSPYHAVEVLEATNHLTFQPVLGLWTRYGLTVNELLDTAGVASSDYCSIRFVDFVNTPING